MKRELTVAIERFPIAGRFSIARGSRTEAVVVRATLREGEAVGQAECVPYARYGESPEGVCAALEALRPLIEGGLDRAALQSAMPAGAARNAADCVLWDLDAKRTGVPAHVSAGLDRLAPATTAFTISLDEPAAMAAKAREAAFRPILKIKLGGPDGDLERIAAVRAAAPDSVLIADANEGWRENDVEAHLAACADAGFALVEQPLPAGRDAILAGIRRPVPVCADESLHERGDLGTLAGRYDAVNVKLDKTGGLTEALLLMAEARRHGLDVMVGCMLGSSLGMAPAFLLTPGARFVDLDGPLLLASDRRLGIRYEGSTMFPPERALWG